MLRKGAAPPVECRYFAAASFVACCGLGFIIIGVLVVHFCLDSGGIKVPLNSGILDL